MHQNTQRESGLSLLDQIKQWCNITEQNIRQQGNNGVHENGSPYQALHQPFLRLQFVMLNFASFSVKSSTDAPLGGSKIPKFLVLCQLASLSHSFWIYRQPCKVSNLRCIRRVASRYPLLDPEIQRIFKIYNGKLLSTPFLLLTF